MWKKKQRMQSRDLLIFKIDKVGIKVCHWEHKTLHLLVKLEGEKKDNNGYL